MLEDVCIYTNFHFSESVPRDREPNTKVRTCVHNQKDAVQVPSETLRAKVVPERVPRRCATVAANKIKIMSNLKQTISGPENVWIRKSSRKLPHRNASAAAKRKLLNVYKEDDTSIHSESEKELEDINSEMVVFQSVQTLGRKSTVVTEHVEVGLKTSRGHK